MPKIDAGFRGRRVAGLAADIFVQGNASGIEIDFGGRIPNGNNRAQIETVAVDEAQIDQQRYIPGLQIQIGTARTLVQVKPFMANAEPDGNGGQVNEDVRVVRLKIVGIDSVAVGRFGSLVKVV